MVAIVPPTLLNLAGLAGMPAEPHVREGNHLRVAHNPVLGLPVAPFVIQRGRIDDRRGGGLAPRRDIVFLDAANRALTLPITVKKGDVIRASVVQGSGLTCIFIALLIRPAPKPAPGDRGSAPPVPLRPDSDVTIDPAMMRAMLGDPEAARTHGDIAGGDLEMRAYGPSIGQGTALIGERRAAPYCFGASSIVEVAVTGTGVIVDAAWIAAQDLAKLDWETIDVLHLPREHGLRYLSVKDARKRAEDRMRGQAPKRRPLQETSGATSPAAAPAFSDSEESDRVHSLSAPIDGDLDALIDGPDAPLLASETIAVTDAAGNPLAQDAGDESNISINHLSRVLQATLDPGVAAWLGYKGLDAKLDAVSPLTFYRVIGFFRHPLAIGATPESLISLPLAAIPQGDRDLSAPEVFRAVTALAGDLLSQTGRSLTGSLEPADDYMQMAAICAVDRRAPPDAPSPPTMLAPEHIAWLPAVPPAAVREIDCPVKDVLVGATLAAEREQPTPGGFVALNRLVDPGPWHTPLTLGLTATNDGAPLAGSDGRQGVIADRAAGADGARYHLAQQDWFGRWSGFAARDAAPGPRPKPPRPIVQGGYAAPATAAAATNGGTLHLRVALPEAEALTPGSFPLSHARLSFRHHNIADPAVETPMPDVSAAVSTAIAIDTPPPGEAPRRAVPATVAGPILMPTEQRRMVVTARWVDTAGQESAPSEPLRLAMTDPRPPAQMPIADILLYSSRPDATGLAWIERSWATPAVNPPLYAIYYTDEVRLAAWLRSEGRDAEAATIAATTDRAARAGMLRAIQADFPDHLFERLPDAVDTPSTGLSRFRHAVSGSSRVLNAYKIAVEAPASGARPDLSSLDMVLYGVPNSDPPPRPSVAVTMVEPMAGDPPLVAEVTVTLEPGVTRGVTARIYRTRGGPTDPLHAPLITIEPLSAPAADTGVQTVTFRDTGAARIAPAAKLSAFSRYQWFAEVQGAPESGSSVRGLWSRPSDPVGLATIPLDAPAAPVLDGFGGTAVPGGTQDLTLEISHPLGLRPTPLGTWRFEVLRAAPGEMWSVLAAGAIIDAPVVISDSTPDGLTPLATQFRVTLLDPAGRSSPSLNLITS